MSRRRNLGILGAAFATVALISPRVAAAADTAPTFTKDIAPILQRSCQKTTLEARPCQEFSQVGDTSETGIG